jgi:hypothetical protein
MLLRVCNLILIKVIVVVVVVVVVVVTTIKVSLKLSSCKNQSKHIVSIIIISGFVTYEIIYTYYES